jgi:hypothetical protein
MKVVETWRLEMAILFQGHSPCLLYFRTYILCFDLLEIPQLAWVRRFRRSIVPRPVVYVAFVSDVEALPAKLEFAILFFEGFRLLDNLHCWGIV